MSQNDKSRKAFEEYQRDTGRDCPASINGNYCSPQYQDDWELWQASEARVRAEYAELISAINKVCEYADEAGVISGTVSLIKVFLARIGKVGA